MLKQKIVDWFNGNSIIGVNISVLSADSYLFDYVLVKNINGELTILERERNIDSIDYLIKKFGVEIPFSLSISGKGVINRIIDSTDEKDDQELIKEVLSNSNYSEFLLSKTRINNHQYYVSACREDLAQRVLQKFSEKGAFVVFVDIDLNPIGIILPHCIQSTTVYTRTNKILINNCEIESIGKLQEDESITFDFFNDKLLSNFFIPYCLTIHFYNSNFKKNGLVRLYDNSLKEYFYSRIFKKGRIAVLIFLFIVLVLNFIVYSYYYSKTSLSIQNLSTVSITENKIDSLIADLELKEKIFKESGFYKISINSFYVDRLLTVIPKGIIISSLEVNPFTERNREGKPISIKNNTIRIKGSTNTILNIKRWIDSLKKYEWISDVIIVDIAQQNTSNTSNFIVEVNVK